MHDDSEILHPWVVYVVYCHLSLSFLLLHLMFFLRVLTISLEVKNFNFLIWFVYLHILTFAFVKVYFVLLLIFTYKHLYFAWVLSLHYLEIVLIVTNNFNCAMSNVCVLFLFCRSRILWIMCLCFNTFHWLLVSWNYIFLLLLLIVSAT